MNEDVILAVGLSVPWIAFGAYHAIRAVRTWWICHQAGLPMPWGYVAVDSWCRCVLLERVKIRDTVLTPLGPIRVPWYSDSVRGALHARYRSRPPEVTSWEEVQEWIAVQELAM